MKVKRCRPQNQDPLILLLNSTVSLFSCLLLSSSWSNSWPLRIRILTLHIPALLLTKSWTSLIYRIRRLRHIQTLRICLPSLSPSCAEFHSSPRCSTSFLCEPNRRLFSESTKCVYRLALQSFACSEMLFFNYKDLFSCTVIWSKASLLFSKCLVYISLYPP